MARLLIKKNNFGKRSGQTIIESLIAIGVLTAGSLGIIGLLNQSLGLNRVVASQTTAAFLAAEGAEVVKNIIDNNVLAGQPWNTNLNGPDCGVGQTYYEADYNSAGLAAFSGSALKWEGANSASSNYHRFNYVSGSATPYVRRIGICWIGSPQVSEIKVTSEVSWFTRGSGNFSVQVEDHFFKWRP